MRSRSSRTGSGTCPRRELDQVARAHPRCAFQHVPEGVHEPEARRRSPITPIGATISRRSPNFLAKWHAGKVGDLQAGLAEVDKTIDAKIEAGREGRGRRAVSLPPVAGGGASPRPRRHSIAGVPGARAAWRRRLIVLAFLSPWIVGFAIFFGYPLVMIGVSLLHALRPPQPTALDRSRELPLSARRRPRDLAGGRNTLWFIAVAVPLQVLFAFGIAVMLTRAKAGVGVFRTVFYLPALVPPVAATLGFVYLLNPATGPVNTHPRQARDRRAAVVQRPGMGEAVAGDAGPVGDRQHDGHLPRGGARRPAASLRVGRPRRGRAVPAIALGDPAD